MTIDIKATVRTVSPTEQIKDTFKKREVIALIDTDTQYPQTIALQAVQDKCEALDELRPGDDVTFTCNLRGNEHNGRVFINLQIWKFTINQTSATAGQAYSAPQVSPVDDSETDNLPF